MLLTSVLKHPVVTGGECFHEDRKRLRVTTGNPNRLNQLLTKNWTLVKANSIEYIPNYTVIY